MNATASCSGSCWPRRNPAADIVRHTIGSLTTVSAAGPLSVPCLSLPARAAARRRRLRRLAAALALAGAAAAGAAGCAARSPTAVADARTAVRVKTALVNDVELGALPIDVRAQGGVVTLEGTVRSVAEIDRALALARGIEGVARVESALAVGDPDPPVVRSEPTLPALAPRPDDSPLRFIGVGVSTRITSPAGDALAGAVDIGPLLRLRPRDGLGPTVAFNWTDAVIEAGPTGRPALAAMRMRPVMAGVEYGVVRGRLAAGASIVAGYAFNSLDVDTTQAGPDRAVAVRNSFVWRSGVSLWYDVAPRLGINLFGGYLFTRPEVTFASDTAVLTERLRANAVVVSIGTAYWIF